MAWPTALCTAISVTQVSTASKSKSTLTDPKLDLLAHMAQGYQLKKHSLGGNPVLHRLKDDEVIRPVSVNRNTIKAMEERGADQSNEGARLAYDRVASEEKGEVTYQSRYQFHLAMTSILVVRDNPLPPGCSGTIIRMMPRCKLFRGTPQTVADDPRRS